MKKGFYILLLILGTGSWGIAQYEFFKVYGDGGYDYCRDLVADVDSAWVLTGSSSSFGSANAEAYIMKIDSIGDKVWSYNYGGFGTEWGQALVLTNDSSYALAGFTNSSGEGGFDFYLVRAAGDGTPIWEKTYGGSDWDKAYDLVQLADSGFIVVGDSYSFGAGEKNAWMIRVDKDGDTLWTKVFDGVGESFFRGIALDAAQDSIVVCGGSEENGAGLFGMEGWVVKMDLNANIGWEVYMGGGGIYDDYFNDVYGDGTNYALGGAMGYTYASTQEDIWLVELNASTGALVWDTTNITPAVRSDIVNAVWIRPTVGVEDVFYAAETNTLGYGVNDDKNDFYFGKRNSGGGHITDKTYGAKGDESAHAIMYTYDDGVIIAGDTKFYSTGGNNVMVLKMDGLWIKPDISTLVYDSITSGIEDEATFRLSIYPNPAHNQLTIDCEKQIDEVQIISLDGRILFECNINVKSLDLSTLKQGAYILRLRIENRVINTQIVKQ